MNHNIHKSLLIALATFMAAFVMVPAPGVSAQNTSSPYSRFGYGILSDGATSAQNQMGGVGYAMNSGRQINFKNPASYANTDSLTFLFDMSLDLTFVNRREDGSERRSDIGGGLDYITMQFPLCKFLGMSVGLLPYSSVGYSFGSKIENGSSSHEGTGGLNQLYAGISGRIVKGLTVGANISYLFGTTYNDVYANTVSSSQSLFEQILEVRDYHLNFGLQYSLNIGRRHRITAGVTYSPSKTLLGHTWIQKYDVGSDEAPDTLNYTSLKNKFSLPETWGAGLAYEFDNRLFAEVDFTYQNWAKAKLLHTEDFTATRFSNRYVAAIGASFTPAIRGSYVRRITYRLGAHAAQDYVMVQGNHVREYGISCGFGLPAPGSKTVINLGFEWLHRACHPTALLTENYFNIRLGINFHQTWFMKNKLR